MKNLLIISIFFSLVSCQKVGFTQQMILGYPKVSTSFNNAVIICDGNSLTYGFASSDPATKSYPARLQLLAPFNTNGATVYNFGVNSQTTPMMLSDVASQVDPLYTPGVKNIVIVLEGGNDIYFNGSATDAYDNLVEYCTDRRAVGFKVIITTVYAREHSACCGGVTPFGDNDAQFESKRQTLNALIRANWEAFADALFDLDANADFETYNSTIFDADKVHLKDAGYQAHANLLPSIILGL